VKRATPVAVLVVCLAWTAAAGAKTFEVTKRGDPAPGACTRNDCSLREAVLKANARPGADSIVLPDRRSYRLTITGTGEDGALDGDLDVSNDPLTISHPGRGRATIAGDGTLERLFQGFAPIALRKLVLTGGFATGDSGGAVQSMSNLRITKSLLRGNHSDGVGGAVDMADEGKLRVLRSTFRDNQSDSTAGAIRDGEGAISIVRSKFIGNEAVSDGGAIRFSMAAARIVRSSFTGNRTTGPDGAGGAIQSDLEGAQVIKKSTFAGNAATGDGGGINAQGDAPLRISSSTFSNNHTDGDGGGAIFGGTVTVTNSTFSGNVADSAGGGIAASTTPVSLNAVTVVRNVADADDNQGIAAIGGGLFGDTPDVFAVRNSIVALNRDAAVGNDCEGDDPIDSLGNNLISTDLGCSDFDGPNDLIRSNPKIGALRKNGGPTKTVALKKGSAAIGHAHKPSAPNRDQRGRKRDNNPDAGAFERGA
jgi:predicted outer membrane repeat protein